MEGEAICDDVVLKILANLPVKSLLRFSGVSKSWSSLISDPQFSNSSHRMQSSVLISEEYKKFSTITVEALLAKDRPQPTPLSLPWETERGSFQNICLGSSNGLVCVQHHSYDMRGLILWNPSTRKFRRIPFYEGYDDQFSFGRVCVYVWFGYDESVSDYKLVLLTCSGFCGGRSAGMEMELLVFTLRSNVWRRRRLSSDRVALLRIKYFVRRDYGIHSKSIGALSSGAVHWINRDFPQNGDACECILALDLATEKFRLMKFRHSRLGWNAWVGSLSGGYLCLCSNDRGNVRNLWMMKEYGVESSWTKVVSIPLHTFYLVRSLYPIILSEEGKELVALHHCYSSDPVERAKIVKLRVEEGTRNVSEEETLLVVHRDFIQGNNVFLHMEESLVSLC